MFAKFAKLRDYVFRARHYEPRALPAFPAMKPVDQAAYRRLATVKDLSMLHVDTLIALRHLVHVTRGTILEIGPYIGGSTIVMAQALREKQRRFSLWPWSRRSPRRALLTVETGGSHPHPTLPSRDILGDLENNLRKHRVRDLVQILVGWSYDPKIVAEIARVAATNPIDLLVIDADGMSVEQDLQRLRPYCAPDCYLVFDDYIECPESQIKSMYVKPIVDRLVKQGRVQTTTVLPWGTWFGRLAA
jgi:predicted O-methyltransferase YrrM